ncbi:MAG TPA: DUF4292 domain-containing protein [Chitinophagaceae bacterium]
MMRLFVIVIAAALFFSSCHSTRKIQTAISKKDTAAIAAPPVKPGEDSAAIIRENFSKLQAQQINFKTFQAKVDVDYVGGDGKKENVNATLRMYKDSVIWISVTGLFGIEGLRAFITTDSIRIINKLDKIYTGRSVAYIQEVTGLPLDLPSLQDLIIGNPVFMDGNIVSYTKAPGMISLLCVGDWFKHLITLNEGVMHRSKLDDIDINRNRTCDLDYNDYETKKGPNFSTKRKIAVSEKTKLDIKLDFKSYSFNETLSFPFSVPKTYKSN